MQKSQRIFQIDALKFWGSIIIVFHHYQQNFSYSNALINFGSDPIIYWGYTVELFFMISGFVMGMKNERNSETPFERFISKRILRIIPLTFVAVVVDCFCRFLYRWKVGTWFRDGAVSLWMIYKNLLLIHAGGAIPDTMSTRLDAPIWYLSVLIICYVLYWLMLWLSKKITVNYNWIFVAIIMLSVGGYCYGINLPFLNAESFRGFAGFFFGLIFYDIYYNFVRKVSKVKTTIYSGIIVLLFLFIGHNNSAKWMLVEQQNFLLQFVFFPAVILWATSSRISEAIFNRPVWGKLGAISFDFFVWHYVIIGFIRIFTDSGEWDFLPSDKTMVIFASIMVVVGFASYYLLEKPLTKWANVEYDKIIAIWKKKEA